MSHHARSRVSETPGLTRLKAGFSRKGWRSHEGLLSVTEQSRRITLRWFQSFSNGCLQAEPLYHSRKWYIPLLRHLWRVAWVTRGNSGYSHFPFISHACNRGALISETSIPE